MAGVTVKNKATDDVITFDSVADLEVQQASLASSKRPGVKESC